MSTCICSSCKNLKDIIDNETNEITEVCEFGFPDESCAACEEVQCALTCEHYIEDAEEEAFTLVKCSACDKELKVAANNEESGEVYCPMCYLNR
ncbi:MAG: hypothetical protein ACRDDX_09080 [Cellulosilyticaceae bacterium]